jgi:hypothetical protein
MFHVWLGGMGSSYVVGTKDGENVMDDKINIFNHI